MEIENNIQKDIEKANKAREESMKTAYEKARKELKNAIENMLITFREYGVVDKEALGIRYDNIIHTKTT